MSDYNIQSDNNINLGSEHQSINMNSLKKISMTARYETVDITTCHDNINITSNNGVNINAQHDAVNIMSAHGNVVINTDSITKINSGTALINTQGLLHLKSKQGNVFCETLIGNICATSAHDVNITSVNSNVNIIGKNDIVASTTAGNVSFNTFEGSINETAYVDINIVSRTSNINETADNSISLYATNGTLTEIAHGNVTITSQTADCNITANTSVYINANIGTLEGYSYGNMTLTSSDGVINVNSSANINLTTGSNSSVEANNIINAPYIYQTHYLLVPTGCIMPYCGSSSPGGWLICNGDAVNRSGTYSALFAVIGTTFGSGNGTTTFNLPDFRSRLPIGVSGSYTLGSIGGAATKTLSESELPSHTHSGTSNTSGAHTHSVTDPGHTHEYYMGRDDGNSSNQPGQVPAGDSDTADHGKSTGSSTTGISIVSNGSHSHSFTTDGGTGGGNSFSILPPYLAINYIIKY